MATNVGVNGAWKDGSELVVASWAWWASRRLFPQVDRAAGRSWLTPPDMVDRMRPLAASWPRPWTAAALAGDAVHRLLRLRVDDGVRWRRSPDRTLDHPSTPTNFALTGPHYAALFANSATYTNWFSNVINVLHKTIIFSLVSLPLETMST